jgi:hypothetical protein
MSSEQNKTIVRRLLEEPWKGNLKVVDELIDRNYVGHDPSTPEPLRGPDGFKETSRPIARRTRMPESPSTNRSPRAIRSRPAGPVAANTTVT